MQSVNGKITAEEFRVELSRLVGRELSFDDCKYGWLGYRKEVPQRNLDALRRLRGDGYRLILLSNTNPFMMSWALTKDFDGGNSSLEDYFDALYLSYRLGVMKPDPKFFQTVFNIFNHFRCFTHTVRKTFGIKNMVTRLNRTPFGRCSRQA